MWDAGLEVWVDAAANLHGCRPVHQRHTDSMKPSSIVPVDELYELGHMLCKLSTEGGSQK